jgi:hypothetical protein
MWYMRFCQLIKWLCQWVEHVSDAPSIPPPNSAAIPLPGDPRNRTQGAELHCFIDAGGRSLDAETECPCGEGDLTPD